METIESRTDAVIADNLMQVVQLPVITERLMSMKEKWKKAAGEAFQLACTENTIQAVKSKRAEMRREFEELENRRKEVKTAVLRPYEQFELVYTDCVTASYKKADETYKQKIAAVEDGMKQRCEGGLRDYFAELCAVEHLDWLTYEQAGIKVDMASAKAKTPKKLQDQLRLFVTSVSESVNRIALLDNADEIMVEYKRTLNASEAICTVMERHKRIEEERGAAVERNAVVNREEESVKRVEALAPPVVIKAEPEPVLKCTFTVLATKEKLRKLKNFLEMEEISYE